MRFALKTILPVAVLLLSSLSARAAAPGLTMNPDLSVILDGYVYYDHFNATDEDGAHVFSEIAGFEAGHHHEGEETHAHEPADGFNWRHAELNFSGSVDPFFKAWVIAAISPEGAELEVAQIETLELPLGLKVKTGKFFSDFGRLNAQHSHQWPFITAPMVNQLFFGHHGINDLGLQVSYLAGLPFYLELGLEGFETGGEENSLAYLGEPPLPKFNSPRTGVAWLKAGPDLGLEHSLLAGASFIQGVRQEEHDGDENGAADHWLSGWAQVAGADLVYKYDDPAPMGKNDIVVEAEYYVRHVRMQIYRHDLAAEMAGAYLQKLQDGLYAQAIYGLWPQWRIGLRFDHLGSLNRVEYPDGSAATFDPTRRTTFMADWSFSEFSRLRWEGSYGEYALADGNVNGWSCGMQIDISLGVHGAHKF
ncbi:MAG: hypothetical protein AB1439_01310 [candidate division FCPU426 bacterium]